MSFSQAHPLLLSEKNTRVNKNRTLFPRRSLPLSSKPTYSQPHHHSISRKSREQLNARAQDNDDDNVERCSRKFQFYVFVLSSRRNTHVHIDLEEKIVDFPLCARTRNKLNSQDYVNNINFNS
jgi:hypothetical protein